MAALRRDKQFLQNFYVEIFWKSSIWKPERGQQIDLKDLHCDYAESGPSPAAGDGISGFKPSGSSATILVVC